MHSVHALETGPAQTAPRCGETDEGWKKVERKRKGKWKEKKGMERKEGSVLAWVDKARGWSVYATVFPGGNRDARPHKARKPRKGSEVRVGHVGPMSVVTGLSFL